MPTDRIPVFMLDPAGATDGQVPTYDAASGIVTWADGSTGPGGGATVLDDLTDVDTTTTPPTTGQVLKFNGTVWAPAADSTGSGGDGSGSGYPPGSADAPPAVANARDDEFDGTSTVTWTTTPTAPNATDRNTTRPHHLYIKAAGSGSSQVGRYQSAPTSYPFTIKTKTTSTARANYHKAGGIILLPASPTSGSGVVYVGPQYNGTHGFTRAYYLNMGTSFQSGTNVNPLLIGNGWYTKVVVNSATSITWYYSPDGFGWVTGETYGVPFSIANIGLAVTEESAGGGVEAFFDFFRVS